MNAPTKIAYLELTVDAEEEVLGFNVSVDDVFAVQIRQSIGHLSDILDITSIYVMPQSVRDKVILWSSSCL
jgi:hypothetical protein